MTHRPLALVAAAILAAGCASQASKEPPPKPFTGTRWALVTQSFPEGEAPYVRFTDGRLEGFGGCNHFAANYVEDSVGAGAIAIRRIEVPNRHACDAAVQGVESRLLESLQSVSSYAITGNALVMTGSSGVLRLVAESAAMMAAGSPGGLTGTRWIGEGSNPADRNAPALEFVTDERIAGYSGCNLLSGSWRMDGDVVRIGRIVVTKRMCAGPGEEAERRVLAVLVESTHFKREGDRLVATLTDGSHYTFVRAP
ncbi:MAG TPA: META domain-containing protein [Usitatibacter sp.]|nr:META domain-containing protein [Usitatibacter sp.]